MVAQLRILLVCGETVQRDRLVEFLGKTLGYQVDTLVDSQDVLGQLERRQGKYDVVIIDDLLSLEPDQAPKSQGLALTKEIKLQYPNTEFIIFTESERAVEALRAGASRYLIKPVNLEELGIVIEMMGEQNRQPQAVILEPVARFVSQAPATIENTNLMEKERETTQEANQRAYNLAAIQKVSTAISSLMELKEILETTCRTAVELFEVDHSGLVLFDPNYEQGEVVAEYPDLGTQGVKIPIRGVPAEEALVKTKSPLVLPEISGKSALWPVRDILERFDIRSILVVPVVIKGRVLGSFSLDAIGRSHHFLDEEAELCKIFAAQVAVAIENAQALAEAKQRNEQLEQLARTSNEIMDNVGNMSLDEILGIIATYATVILHAEACGIFLVKRFGFLSLEASHGHRAGMFEKGKELAIRSGPQTGLTGHIAYEGKLFNAYGNELDNHFAVKGAQAHAASGTCCSLLAIPLKKKGGQKEELIGLLRADNKKGKDGQASPDLGFTLEDEWILRLFADIAVVAIEEAKLVAQLSERKDYLSRLLASSPNGVIAIDRNGLITAFNERAQEILKYQSEELLGTHIFTIYDDSQEGRKVVRLLYDASGDDPVNHETFIRNKEGEQIPIRLAATWLYNAKGKRIGSVGYFEDLRSIRETEQRLELLLRASNIVAQAKSLTDGLQRLAEMLVTFLDTTFCCVFLLDESQQFLVPKAIYSTPRFSSGAEQRLELKKRIAVAEWPPLVKFLATGSSTVLNVDNRHTRPLLAEWIHNLGLERAAQSLLAIPLRTRDRMVGLLILGEMVPWKPSLSFKEKLELAEAIADQTAVLILETQLLHDTKMARERLRSLYKASNSLVSSQDPERVLQDIVEQTCVAADAAWVSVIIIDEIGQARRLIKAGTDKQFDLRKVIRPNGISVQVMRAGKAEVIDDTHKLRERVNPSMFRDGIAAALCLPLSLREKSIGVMWVHYHESHHFSEFEIEALQLYVNQATIAYDNARRIKELEYMRRAAEALASAAGLPKVLAQIVHSAQEVLQADSAVIWSYDPVRHEFILESSVAAGISDRWWEEFQKAGPRRGGTADVVMSQGWIGVRDVTDLQQYGFLGSSTRQLLQHIGAKSFQGIALTVGEERFGILYVNYNYPRSFSQEEQKMARTFANHAALALRNARLLDQVSRARNTAKVVAEVTTLEDINKTLQSVAEGTQNALDCDAITLYGYDQHKNKLMYPPIMIGVKYPDRASQRSHFPEDYVVFQILKRNQSYIAEDATDPLFKGRRFAQDEGIASCVAIPLKVGIQKVGVMFVNYRSPHRFTEDEIANIELFAYQAAVAIHNAQLYEQVRRRAGALQTLYEAGRVVTGSLDLKEILFSIAQQAWQLTSTYDEKEARFSHLALVDGNMLRFVAAYPPEHLTGLEENIGDIDLEHGPIGVTGQAVKTGESQLIRDVTQNSNYLKYDSETHTELAVPIKVGGQITGVINVEHSDPYVFDEEDRQTLESLAAQAGIAIQNARFYQQVTERLEESNALQQVAFSLAGTSELEEVLSLVMGEAMKLTGTHQANTLLWDAETKNFMQALRVDIEGRLQWYPSTARNEGGLTREIIDEQKTVVISDTRQDPRTNLVFVEKAYLATVGIPLLSQRKAIGVLYVHSREPCQFSERQVILLEALARLAAVAIDRARQYEELKHTKGLVGTITAISWMGTVAGTWRHSVGNLTATVADLVELIRFDLEQDASADKIETRLIDIEETIAEIKRIPFPPLSNEDGVESVFVDQLINERIGQFQKKKGKYGSVNFEVRHSTDNTASVRASPEWLRRVIDIVVDNAMQAMDGVRIKQLTITSHLTNGGIEISLSDTGKGISPTILSKLFKEPVKKQKGEKGSGLGLFLARAIVQTYGGTLEIASTDTTGTIVVIWLPLEV